MSFIWLVRLDLARMYDLVAKIPDGLVELKRLLETYIYTQGMEAIEKCCDASINVIQASPSKFSRFSRPSQLRNVVS